MPKNFKRRASAPSREIRELGSDAPIGPVTYSEWRETLSRDGGGRIEVGLSSTLGLSTFQQGIQLIARKIAETPLCPMRKTEDGGWSPAEDFPTYRLLRYAVSSYQTPFVFWSALVSQAVATGLGLARIIRRDGALAGFEVLYGAKVRVDTAGDRIVYDCQGKTYDARECLEIRGMTFDGITTLNPIDLASAMHRTRIAECRYQAGIYENGAGIRGVLTSPHYMDEEQAAQQAKAFAARHVGPDNAGRPAVLTGGMDFKPLEHSPADTEVVESAKFGISEVARLLNLPGWIVNAPDAIKPESNEEAMAQFAVLTLSPWFTQIQAELDFKCVDPKDWGQIEHRFDTHSLVKADAKTLADMAIRLSSSGLIDKNDGRAMLGRSPIDNPFMKTPWIGTNNQAPMFALNWGQATQPGANWLTPLPAPKPEEDEGQEAVRALAGILADPLTRFANNDANALRRMASKPRFDLDAEAHFRSSVPKLAAALAPAVRAVNSLRGLTLDPETIARGVADAALADLRPLYQGFAPDEIGPHLDPVLAAWSDRATSLAGQLVLKQGV